MSVYFVFCTKNIPQNLNIVLPCKTMALQKLNVRLIPKFYIPMKNKHFYFLDGEINFKRLNNVDENYTMADKFNCFFQEERNILYRAVSKWLFSEILLGNSIYMLRQIETNDVEEREYFNTIYDCKLFMLGSVCDNEEVKYDFNIAYEIVK